MVRILPSGEVVHDEDPRAQRQRGRPQANINTLQHDDDDEQQMNQGQGHAQENPLAHFFLGLNQRLSDAGVPRWNLGPYVVEPIVSAGFLIALLLIGFRGLIFGLLLFFASKWSMGSGGGGAHRRAQRPQGPPGGPGPAGGPPRRPGPPSGAGGHRLGRN